MTFPNGREPSGRVAIVTGGSRGVGRATVSTLAARGYAVVVNYLHDQPGAESLVEEVLASNGAAVAVRADVADELDVERLFGETISAFNAVDAVVHTVRARVRRCREKSPMTQPPATTAGLNAVEAGSFLSCCWSLG